MKKRFKIGYFADGPWSHQAFERIIKDESIKIEFIVPRSDTSDQTLLNYSNKYKIPYFREIKINSDEFYEIASTYACDLFVSMSFNQIFRKKIIYVLPFNRLTISLYFAKGDILNGCEHDLY